MDVHRPRLFCDRGCPYAHRVLALLHHLDVTADRHEAPVGTHPEGVLQFSRSGRLPLLVHGRLALTESRVMLEYLAEYYALSGAWSPDLESRTLQRQAMAVADDYLTPLLALSSTPPSAQRLEDALDALQDAASITAPEPCLLTFHLAPIWLAFRGWHPRSSVTRAIEGRPGLRSWLDRASQLPCIVGTTPSPASQHEDLARARAAGLI